MGNLLIIGLLTALFTVLLGKESAFQDRPELLNHELHTTKLKLHSPSSTHPNLNANFHLSVTSVPESEISSASNNVDVIPDEQQYFTIPLWTGMSFGNPYVFDIDSPDTTIMKFCSSTQSCQKENSTYMDDVGGICCMECDCSDGCYATGTCCPEMTIGKPYRNDSDISFSETGKSCVTTFIRGSDYKRTRIGYLLFQKCDDTTDYQLQNKCLHPDVFQIEEMIPVFSRRTNRHYRNIYCAKCHNDSLNIIMWETIMTCKSKSAFPKLSSAFTIPEFISNNPDCALSWYPPSNVKEKKAEPCLRGEDIVSDCNKTVLESLCNQYYAPVTGGDIIYRNVFCMECANPSNLTGHFTECSPDNILEPVPSFLSMLSLNMDGKKASVSDSSADRTCPSPKRYNGNLESCVHQMCAIPEVKVQGTCKQIFSSILNSHFEFRLKLQYRVFSQETWNSLKDLNVNPYILQVSGNTRNDMCWLGHSVENKTTFVEVRVSFTMSASISNIQQSYEEFTKRIKNYNNIAKENITMFLVEMDHAEVQPILEDSVTFVKFTRFNSTRLCHNAYAMTRLQFCDIISFHENEFIIYDNGNVSIDNLMFRPGEFVLRKTLNGSIENVQLCMDDFISKYKFINGKYRETSAAEYAWKQRSEILYLLFAVIGLGLQASQ